MYVPNQTIALGTPNVCHVTTKPQLPAYLADQAGYISFIRDTGCDELQGYQNLGAAVCIWLSTYTRNWIGAQYECQAKGGRLAVLDTPAKYKAVVERLKATQPKPPSLFVNALVSQSGWQWEGGASVNNTFWAPGEPSINNYYSRGMLNSDKGYLLADVNWWDGHYFACQGPPKF
ncbi:C-type lectin domain family 17, member A [Hyalella azteca]|uniref:C-type lectin domain family 17, member A n=1 Tax=Hyalella azteca TaxID=294128 RepID=A0A8B7PGA8_HYAAZ|nr:C-type lectin domain family 17, member A [Hyalella azteca]